jgi:hypothetical protein
MCPEDMFIGYLSNLLSRLLEVIQKTRLDREQSMKETSAFSIYSDLIFTNMEFHKKKTNEIP